MTDLLSSIRNKIQTAERHTPGPDPEILEAKKSNAEKLKQVLPPQVPVRQARSKGSSGPGKKGRPRLRRLTKQTGSVPPQAAIGAWVTERLIAAPEYCEFIGGYHTYTVTRRDGVAKRHYAEYRRLSLREDYERFCQQKNYPPAGKGQTFSANLIRVLNERGIATRFDRAQRTRRKVLWGVCLRDQIGWRGNDTQLPPLGGA